MATYDEITEAQTDAKSPINEDLMRGTAGGSPTGGTRGNFINHEDRLIALEAATGGAAAGTALDDPRIGEVLHGLKDNTAKEIRRRFHPASNFVSEKPDNITAYDPWGEDQKVLLNSPFGSGPYTTSDPVQDAQAYLGFRRLLNSGLKMYFKKKKGLNYFGLIYLRAGGHSASMTISIDGVVANTYGATDENGVAHAATFSTAIAPSLYGFGIWFHGLDPDKEEMIEVSNTGGSAFHWEGIEVGYFNPPATLSIAHDDVKLSKGRFKGRAAEVSVAEQTLSFDAAEGYGRTDVVAVDQAGVVSVIKGAEGGMCQVKPDQAIEPGTTTSFSTRDNYFMGDKGIAVLQYPTSQTVVFSFTGRDRSLMHDQQFTGVKWESTLPSHTPETATEYNQATNAMFGALNIVLLADGSNGVTVSASNNKLDFRIKVDNDAVFTTHTATLADGFYTADLMKLGDEIVRAMQTVKPLPDKGTYFAEYSKECSSWLIGIRGSSTVTAFGLDFGTGPSIANSIHSDIGFNNTDLEDGSTSYIAQNEKQHLACRTFDKGNWKGASDPTIFYMNADQGNTYGVQGQSVEKLLGLGYIRQNDQSQNGCQIYTSEDACGIDFSVLHGQATAAHFILIENGNQIYIAQPDFKNQQNANTQRGELWSYSVSFPRGTTSIFIMQEFATTTPYTRENNSDTFWSFAGYREHHTHAPLEKLTTQQSALPDFYDIRPKVFYREPYGYNYVPQGSNEKIDNMTFSGAWAHNAGEPFVFGGVDRTTTINDFVDIEFTLDGDGGGFGITTAKDINSAGHVDIYLGTGSASGNSLAANLIQRVDSRGLTYNPGVNHMELYKRTGLDAGTYVARIQKRDASGTRGVQLSSYNIYDTTETAPEIRTPFEQNNTGQAPSHPSTGIKYFHIWKDNTGNVPQTLLRSGFREGMVNSDFGTDNQTANGQFSEDVAAVIRTNATYYPSMFVTGSAVGNHLGFFNQTETIFSRDSLSGFAGAIMQPIIDGTVFAAYNQDTPAKGLGGYTLTAQSLGHVCYRYNFHRKATGDMSDANTIPFTDTSGMRVGSVIRITADSQTTVTTRILSIVNNVSIDIAKDIAGFATYTTANNLKINFAGNHRVKLKTTNAQATRYNSWGILVLPVVRKKSLLFDGKEGEVATVEYQATGSTDLAHPVYKSDGQTASQADIIPIVTKLSAAAVFYNFDQGLKNLVVSGGTIDLKLLAIRRRR